VPYFNTVRASAAFVAQGSPVSVIEIDTVFGLPTFPDGSAEKLVCHKQSAYLLCMVATRAALFGQ
jgi:hypothetical protein